MNVQQLLRDLARTIAINESIGEIVCEINRVPSINRLRDQLLMAINLLNNSNNEDFTHNQECIKLLLILRPQVMIPLVKAKTDWLSDKQLMLPLVKLNGLLLEYLPSELKQDKEVVLNAATHTHPGGITACR